MVNKLDDVFYENPDVTAVAAQLLGKELFTNIDGLLTSGIIVETEAYSGAIDSACHAFPDKKTPRTAVMFEPGGVSYVYFVYGMHYMFNVVTNVAGKADAVLIRAVAPNTGLDIMQHRRNVYRNDKSLTGGPARMAQALGITKAINALKLDAEPIWIAPAWQVKSSDMIASPRIGVDYAGEDALLPWRFSLKNNPYVSRPVR
jgi:DNA-3-methyladenine glycosylase